MEQVTKLVNQIKEICPEGSTIYLSYNPIEFHITCRKTFIKNFPKYQANPWPSEMYPIELSSIINGVKFFTLEDEKGWYPDAVN